MSNRAKASSSEADLQIQIAGLTAENHHLTLVADRAAQLEEEVDLLRAQIEIFVGEIGQNRRQIDELSGENTALRALLVQRTCTLSSLDSPIVH